MIELCWVEGVGLAKPPSITTTKCSRCCQAIGEGDGHQVTDECQLHLFYPSQGQEKGGGVNRPVKLVVVSFMAGRLTS